MVNPMNSTDIAIVGGGGMGSACACFLKLLGPPDLKVTVFEADPTYARASTTLAAGGIRQQFSTAENILMSQFGFGFMANIAEELTVEGHETDVGLHATPYLHLAAGDQVEGLRESYALQRELGGLCEWLDRDTLATRFGWMNFDDVDAAVLGGPREGTFDPASLLAAFRRKAIALGVVYRKGRVDGFEQDAQGRIVAVRTGDEAVPCGLVVNAAGAQSGAVAALAGCTLPVRPMRAHTFVFRAQERPEGLIPIVVDSVLMLNFRAEGDQFLTGSPREEDFDRGGEGFEVDHAMFEAVHWPLLATRVPAFEAVRATGGWVGHMEWNTFDANGIVGPHAQVPNMILATGFSGHGAQHIPAVGRAVAELIVHGGFRSIDLTRFGHERIAAGIPLVERY